MVSILQFYIHVFKIWFFEMRRSNNCSELFRCNFNEGFSTIKCVSYTKLMGFLIGVASYLYEFHVKREHTSNKLDLWLAFFIQFSCKSHLISGEYWPLGSSWDKSPASCVWSVWLPPPRWCTLVPVWPVTPLAVDSYRCPLTGRTACWKERYRKS